MTACKTTIVVVVLQDPHHNSPGALQGMRSSLAWHLRPHVFARRRAHFAYLAGRWCAYRRAAGLVTSFSTNMLPASRDDR
jgi:hypothetical protein